jgi:signal transduction histidine kinase
VEIAVADNGIGIPPEHLPKIFERFYQVDGSSTRKHGGAGLGLAIVKKIVEAHGGAVAVESALNRGTVFRVRLPAFDSPWGPR